MSLNEKFPVRLVKSGKKYAGKFQTVVGRTILDYGATMNLNRTVSVIYTGNVDGNRCPMERVMKELDKFDKRYSPNAFTSIVRVHLPENHPARRFGCDMRLSLKLYSIPELDAEEERKAIRNAKTGEDEYI